MDPPIRAVLCHRDRVPGVHLSCSRCGAAIVAGQAELRRRNATCAHCGTLQRLRPEETGAPAPARSPDVRIEEEYGAISVFAKRSAKVFSIGKRELIAGLIAGTMAGVGLKLMLPHASPFQPPSSSSLWATPSTCLEPNIAAARRPSMQESATSPFRWQSRP